MSFSSLVEGGKTGKANKSFPDSLLSNSAYMLVYDAANEEDAVPTLPAWLEPLIDAKNAELANEDDTLKTEEVPSEIVSHVHFLKFALGAVEKGVEHRQRVHNWHGKEGNCRLWGRHDRWPGSSQVA